MIKLNEVRDTQAPEIETVREEIELQLRQTRVQSAIEDITAKADVDKSASESIDPTLLKNFEMLE